MKRLRHLVRKELIELRRDPRLFGIVIIAPIVQLTMLGYAATTDVHDVPMVVVDQDRSAESRALIEPVRRVAELRGRGRGRRRRARSRRLWTRGRAWMALTIPPDYGERLRAGVAHDGAGRRRRHRRQLHERRARLCRRAGVGLRRASWPRAAGRAAAGPLVSAEVRVWFNPQLESRVLHDPGHPRAAAAGGHDEPVVDGDRPREGAGHARAAERHAASPAGS